MKCKRRINIFHVMLLFICCACVFAYCRIFTSMYIYRIWCDSPGFTEICRYLSEGNFHFFLYCCVGTVNKTVPKCKIKIFSQWAFDVKSFVLSHYLAFDWGVGVDCWVGIVGRDLHIYVCSAHVHIVLRNATIIKS